MDKVLRFGRNCVAIVGCVSGLIFTIVGSIIAIPADEAIGSLVVCVGSLLLLQSIIIFGLDIYTDKIFEKAVDELEKTNKRLESDITQLRDIGRQYTAENDKLRQNLTQLIKHKEDLQQSVDSLEKLRVQYTEKLAEVQQVSASLTAEIERLEALRLENTEEIESLRNLVNEQKSQIDSLAQQARNLNELQRKSVQMIQSLVAFGQEVKEAGVDLRDIQKNLKETDDSLGLTAQEMRDQLTALTAITENLAKARMRHSMGEGAYLIV